MLHHEQQMMVMSSLLSDFLALWSSHCQVKNRPQGADSADPYYQICCFLWHVEISTVRLIARGVDGAGLSPATCVAQFS